VVIMPTREKRTVKRIEISGSEAQHAVPGDPIGIVLDKPADLKRGYVLTSAGEKLEPTKEFTAELIIFGDLTLKTGSQVSIRIGTATVNCTVQRILEKINPVSLTVMSENPESLTNGEVGKATFRPNSPLYAERYSDFPQLGRFVIIGERGAVAAGIILEKK